MSVHVWLLRHGGLKRSKGKESLPREIIAAQWASITLLQSCYFMRLSRHLYLAIR